MFEVETRVYFNSYDECITMIPGIEKWLNNKIEFENRMYGEKNFSVRKDIKSNEEYK